MAFFAGIDGNGQQTTCVLGDEEKILASVVAAGSDIAVVGYDGAREALQSALQGACKKAGTKSLQVSVLYAGIAGAANEPGRKQLLRILSKVTSALVELTSNVVIAHLTALRGEPGIVIVADAESVAYAVHASGRTARAGGWGHAISEEASSYWIGVQGAAAVVQALDCGEYTKLSDLILQRWRVGSYDEFVACANGYPLPDFPSLFPDVLEAARANDSYAANILRRAGAELAILAEVVFRRLWKPDDMIDIAFSGDVFVNSSEVRESCERQLKRSLPQANIFLATGNPAETALEQARALLTIGA